MGHHEVLRRSHVGRGGVRHGGARGLVHPALQQCDGAQGDRGLVGGHGAQGGDAEASGLAVVEADDGDLTRNAHAVFVQCAQGAQRRLVVEAEQGVGAAAPRVVPGPPPRQRRARGRT
jgi:hypothetical protein